MPGPQEELEDHRRRELRRAPEAAVRGIERRREPGDGRLELVWLDVARARRHGELRPKMVRERARLLLDLGATSPIRVGDRVEDARQAWHAVPVLGREVGAAEERREAGGQEDRHRPASGAGHRLNGGHVDVVEVGALLAVHLDRHEALVHERGDLGVLERLALHDVAPVTGGVADREEDRLVLVPGPLERLGSPRVPVDRVVGVLKQVWTRLVREAIGHAISVGTRAEGG